MRRFGDRRLQIALAAVLALSLGGLSAAAFLSGGTEEAPGVRPSPTTGSASPSPAASADPSDPEPLDRAGAKAEFARLHDLAQTLSAHRDIDFLPNVFTPDGPMLERARERITALLSDQVLDRSTVTLRSIEVRRLREGDVRLLAESINSPCFVTDGGADITNDRQVVISSVLWTMRWDAGKWKLHDAVLRDQKPSGRRPATCPPQDG